MTTLPAQPHDSHHGGHDHSEYPFLRHHFETPAQQFDSGKLGMWLFLATEVLFFGGLFVWYVVLRSQHPEIFSYAAQYLNTLPPRRSRARGSLADLRPVPVCRRAIPIRRVR